MGEPQALEAWRVAYLGRRSGSLTQALRGLGALQPEERRGAGALANDVKAVLESRLTERKESLRAASLERAARQDRLDVTLPGTSLSLGRLHPTTQVLREVCGAFVSMGFQVVEGPEVEWDRFNFELLNIPRDHPARDMWNTLWVDAPATDGEGAMLLRTPHVPHAGPHHAGGPASRARRGARPLLPLRGQPTPPTSGTSSRSKGWRWTKASPWLT